MGSEVSARQTSSAAGVPGASSVSRAPGAVGFIPLENLVGRAEFIFFSWDGSAAWWEVWAWPLAVRWTRLLSAIR